MSSRSSPVRTQLVAGGFLLGAVGLGVAFGMVGWQAALLVLAAAGGAVVLYRPVLGLLAVAFLIPFEGLLLLPGANSATKLLAAVVAGAWLVAKLARREPWERVLESRVTWAVAVFLAYCFASVLWSELPQATGGIPIQLVRVVMLVGLGLLTMDLVRTWREANWLVRALVVGGTIGAMMTLWQFTAGDPRRAGEGISGGINATALVLLSLIPFAFVLIRGERRLRWRAVGMAYVAISCSAIALTLSRMSFLVLPLILGLELWETLKNRAGRTEVLALFAGGGVMFFSLVPLDDVIERAETIGPYIEETLSPGESGLVDTSSRGFHIMVALSIFGEHPFVGAGYGNYGHLFIRQYQFEVPGSDNLYGTPRSAEGNYWAFLADLGLIGISLWLAVLWFAFTNLKRAWSQLSHDRTSPRFLIVHGVSIVFLVQCIYGAYHEMHLEKIFWIILGLTVALRGLAEAPTDRPDGPPRSDERVAGKAPRVIGRSPAAASRSRAGPTVGV